MRLLTTARGIGLLDAHGSSVRLVYAPAGDLGDVLRLGLSVEDIAGLPVVDECPLGDVTLLPTVRPANFWAQGAGYREHLAPDAAPSHPRVFLLAPSSAVGSGASIVLPAAAPDEVDYEGEVAVVIGRKMHRVRAAHVWDHVAGVTLVNDVSARDVQRGRHPAAGGVENVDLAKSFDTFSPMGPALATLDELSDPDDITLLTSVDGEVRQRSSTAHLVFGVPALLEFLSARVTLHPGDVVSTGSPAGIGEPTGRYLRAGSTVTVASPAIGSLTNKVIMPAARVNVVPH